MRNRQRCHTETCIYPHICICSRPLCVLSLIARGPPTNRRRLPFSAPSVWGENAQQFAFHKANKKSIPFLCLTTQRNLLLLQNIPKQTLFLCTHRRTRHNYTYIFQILLKCRFLCFSFSFVFPPAMKNSENLIHLVTHSGAHKKNISEIKISSSNQKFKGEQCFQ